MMEIFYKLGIEDNCFNLIKASTNDLKLTYLMLKKMLFPSDKKKGNLLPLLLNFLLEIQGRIIMQDY